MWINRVYHTWLERIRQLRPQDRVTRLREWYEPVARDLLQQVVDQGLEVRLLTDGTKIGFGHQSLTVSLA